MNALTGFISRQAAKIKIGFLGRTFFCPVCHLELSEHDTDKDGLLVCPLCGVVIELTSVMGHMLPVVHDIEINRSQPKARIHPLLTHLAIGLWPFGVLGAILTILVSWTALQARILSALPAVNLATLILLGISVSTSFLTAASGFWDWRFRYGRRPYRIIRLKIILSVLFFILGTAAFLLHASGLVIDPATGLWIRSTAGAIWTVVHLSLLLASTAVIAALGHIGGNLVFGK